MSQFNLCRHKKQMSRAAGPAGYPWLGPWLRAKPGGAKVDGQWVGPVLLPRTLTKTCKIFVKHNEAHCFVGVFPLE